MLSGSIWSSAPNFWMGGGLESRCVGRVYGADGAVPCTVCCSVNFTHFIPGLTKRDCGELQRASVSIFFTSFLHSIHSMSMTCEYQRKPTFHARTHAHAHKSAYCALHLCSNDTSAYRPTILIFNISRKFRTHPPRYLACISEMVSTSSIQILIFASIFPLY